MSEGNVHVHPVNDLIEHDTDGDACACEPRVELVLCDDGTFNSLVVHNSLDGREIHESDFMPIVAGRPLDKKAWQAYGRAHGWLRRSWFRR